MSQPHENAPLYLLDVYAFVYRAYFAFIRKPLRNARGENVSAVYGFFRFLFSLFEQRKPALFAAVLDSRGPTFRHQQFEAYKATRQKTPDDLLAQFPKVEALLEALSVPALRCEGYEADDVIATLARKCEREGRACFIVSGDKDLLQLVGNGTRALRPAEGFGFREIDAKGVFDEWGVTPAQIRDYLSLVGDVSDNVPGVKGIGDKTAQKLLAQFGSLDALYERLDEVEPESLRRKLEAGKEDAFVSRELVMLCENVPECLVEPAALVARLDHTRAAPLFLADDMKSLVPEAVTVSRSLSSVFAADTGAAGPQATTGTELEQAQPAAPSLSPSLATTLPAEAPSDRLAAAPGLRSSVPVHYEAVLDAATLTRVIDRCLAAGVCALDTETTSLDPLHADLVGFSLCCEEGIAWYVPLINPEGQSVGIEAARHALARLTGMGTEDQVSKDSAMAHSSAEQATATAPAATGTELVLVGHNIKFDLHVLARLGIRVRRP
ncbi:MAG: 5'-3' exonuclease H3TH domain-containing protein, partial [Spirochaetales bacterium]|nr:5'-3' exonuclease H3TH domain-containing protein [Spirochaetales bacterium]